MKSTRAFQPLYLCFPIKYSPFRVRKTQQLLREKQSVKLSTQLSAPLCQECVRYENIVAALFKKPFGTAVAPTATAKVSARDID